MRISVIIPALNEAHNLAAGTQSARCVSTAEIIVVDGGSQDNSMDVASAQGAIVLASKTSRAVQMNVGARPAPGDALVFLHADTVLPAGFDGHVCHLLASAGN